MVSEGTNGFIGFVFLGAFFSGVNVFGSFVFLWVLEAPSVETLSEGFFGSFWAKQVDPECCPIETFNSLKNPVGTVPAHIVPARHISNKVIAVKNLFLMVISDICKPENRHPHVYHHRNYDRPVSRYWYFHVSSWTLWSHGVYRFWVRLGPHIFFRNHNCKSNRNRDTILPRYRPYHTVPGN